MHGLLKGKAALVTGASSERGTAIARALADEGCAVAIHYHKDRESARTLQKNIHKTGQRAEIFPADLSSVDEIEALFKAVSSRIGPLNVLVNNAHAEIIRRPFNETGWGDYMAQIDVLLKGAFTACSLFLEQMDEGGNGSIIQILSSQLDRPVSGYTAFASALGALHGFSKNLTIEAAPQGVRVNSIAPGFLKTRDTPHAPDWVREKIIQETPLKRLVYPEDLGNAVVFFASDLSGFITGSCLTLDGGRSLV